MLEIGAILQMIISFLGAFFWFGIARQIREEKFPARISLLLGLLWTAIALMFLYNFCE